MGVGAGRCGRNELEGRKVCVVWQADRQAWLFYAWHAMQRHSPVQKQDKRIPNSTNYQGEGFTTNGVPLATTTTIIAHERFTITTAWFTFTCWLFDVGRTWFYHQQAQKNLYYQRLFHQHILPPQRRFIPVFTTVHQP